MIKEKGALSGATIAGLMILAFALMVLRRPDIVTNAQPWAEDGRVWLAGIYNSGFWSSLLLPQNGYYQTISRLTYGIALWFGLSNAALVANIIAVLIRLAFCSFILSGRMNFAPIIYRLVAVAYLILMPNLEEGFVNITNIHWYLSMYLVAVVMADKPESKFWKAHDYFVLIISALSGPFVVFIAPCLLIKRIYERGGIVKAIRGINPFDLIMAACCIIQVAAILTAPDAARSSAPLGASIETLIKILSYRVVAGSFFDNGSISFMPNDKWLCSILFAFAFIPAFYFFVKESWRFKVALLFPTLMIGFALAKPMMSTTDPQWPVFFGPGNGERYFFVTNFAFYCFALFMIHKANRSRNILFPTFAVISLILVLPNFRMTPMPDSEYKEDLVKFEGIKRGESMDIRINPPGWTMTLRKK